MLPLRTLTSRLRARAARARALPAVLCALAGFASGCPAENPSAAAGRADAAGASVVASGHGVLVTADDLRIWLKDQPPGAPLASAEGRRELLLGLVRFELLAREAQRRGLDREPDVALAVKKIAVQKLLGEQPEKTGGGVPEEELKHFYEVHRDEFVRPEKVRVTHLVWAVPRGGTQHAKTLNEARKLAAKARVSGTALQAAAVPGSARGTAPFTSTELGFLSRSDLESRLGAEVAHAAFALEHPGEFSAVIDTPQGVHLLRLDSRTPALYRPFEEARAELTARVQREQRSRELEQSVRQLVEVAKVTINDGELERVLAATASPSAANVSRPSGSGP